MRYVRWAIAIVVGILGIVTLVGALLPVRHVAIGSAAVAAAPDAVFEVIRRVDRYAEWRFGLTRVELLDSVGGRLRFREHADGDALTMEVVEMVAPTRMVTRIADPDLPFGGTWTFEVTAANGGATVTITERGEVRNPIFRFVARFVIGHHRGVDQYLADLRRVPIVRVE